jgi:acyl-coenzyme A thioesterase PaaI-like protein
MGLIAELRDRGTVADFQLLVERIPYARLLGLSIDGIDPHGQLVTRLRFDPRVVGNPNLPAIHGGVIGAFLEMAAIFQLVREGEGDHLPKPINLTVEYLRSAGPRDTYAARRSPSMAGGSPTYACRLGKTIRSVRSRSRTGIS